ncbi:flagellar basal-body MS-ring/collar protein FliF [Virgibacillus sp. W0181]|uniref:flagellar basal-body MS-ring/collar protein FliF n=1 Tax=Virgibacillus sp. W0181 TaxID=3391581 RepID=UPI003F478C81
MKEKIKQIKERLTTFWTSRTKSQKVTFVGSIAIIFILIGSIIFLTSNTKYVPLYSNLSLQEIDQIKTELDAKSVPYELDAGGTTISVPEDQVDSLIVELAGQGIPHSGNIDYSFFSENASWGITDNEFNIMKLDAMQTELANLMKGIEGIDDAQVMINIPEETVFVTDTMEKASASIVLNTKLGYEFQGNQVETLYHLVSKAVPNLPADNIVIMNQYFEYFEQNAASNAQNEYTYQQTVKKDVERDIRKRLQQMLGAMVGMEKVIVSVTTDIDFTNENRTEELVDPVDLENMEGLPVSIETVHETYSGNQPIGGVAGTGEEDIANYPEAQTGDDGEYELVKETINNEFNRVRKDIVESPFKIRDIGIQVAVDNLKATDENDEIQYLSTQEQSTVEQTITSILNSMISTSIDKEYGEVNPEEKISIVFQEFTGKQTIPESPKPIIPIWMYVVGGLLLLIIIVLFVLLLRNRKQEEEITEVPQVNESAPEEIPEISEKTDSQSDIQRKQLEKMAKDKPEEFAKLLRTWITDD